MLIILPDEDGNFFIESQFTFLYFCNFSSSKSSEWSS